MKHFLIVFFLLFLAFALRWHNYSVYPQRGATSDEYAFAFQGISLLTRGIPIAWSAIPLYKNLSHLTIDGLYFPIVQPYLDHPPLFGLLVGAWAIFSRETAFEAVRLATIRIIPVTLSFVSAIFLYLIAKREFGERIALFSLAIFSVATIIVVNSRVAVAESLFTPMWLIALWMVGKNIKKSLPWPYITIGLLCAGAILTKILGLVVWLSVVAILWVRRSSVRNCMYVTIGALIGALVLYLYGMAYDEKLFWAIQSYQGMNRVLGPNTIWMIVGSPSIVNKIFYDGWYFWGLFALGVASIDIRKNVMIVVPALLYLFLLVVSVNETDIHGWYFLPLFPFLALAGGKLLVDSLDNGRWTLFIWVILIGVTLIGPLYGEPFGLTPGVYRWLIGIIVVLGLFSLRSKRMAYGTVWLYIIGTAIATLRYVHPA